MTPSVTIWGWLMHNWIMWHFFPCGSHCAWFFVPLIKCKEPSHYVCKGVWAQEATAGKTGNSSTYVFKLKHSIQLLAYKNQGVTWLGSVLYLSQKGQSQRSTNSVAHHYRVVTQRSLLESLLFSTVLVMNFQDISWDASHFQREACVPKQDFKFPRVKGRKSRHKLL